MRAMDSSKFCIDKQVGKGQDLVSVLSSNSGIQEFVMPPKLYPLLTLLICSVLAFNRGLIPLSIPTLVRMEPTLPQDIQ
jgi:hypothetical protein